MGNPDTAVRSRAWSWTESQLSTAAVETDRDEPELGHERGECCELLDEADSFPLTTLLTKVLDTILLKHPIVACIFNIFVACSVGINSLHFVWEPDKHSELSIQWEVDVSDRYWYLKWPVGTL